MKNIKLGLSLIAICAVSTSAFAVDGTIIFRGELVATTCTPTVSSAGANISGDPAIVNLPKVTVSSLKTANQTAGNTAFSISLNGGTAAGCVSNGIIGKPYFEPEALRVDYTTGALKNALPGTATNVNVQLLNNTGAVIDLSKDASAQIFSVGELTGTSHKYNYTARYLATGLTTAGTVKSTVSYTVIYK